MISEVVKTKQIRDVHGKGLARAFLGTEKDTEVEELSGVDVLRLIPNLVRPNEIQHMISEDNRTMPYSSQ